MRYSDFKLVESKRFIFEAAARIDHAEDILFWEGSQGAKRVIDAIKSLEQKGHQDVTIKWDGSPAVIFGRNDSGEFILTDKSGFSAKGYDGKAKSADDLEKMLLNRPGANNPDPKKKESYRRLTANMKDIFDEYEKAVPKDYVGFFKGDILYFNTPEKTEEGYMFTPNIVTYTVDPQSDLGKKIAQSKTGVVIHRQVDMEGNESPLQDTNIFQGNEVLVVPPITVEKPAAIDNSRIANLEAEIQKNSAGIDEMMDPNTLTQMQLKDFPKILYAYVNSSVDNRSLDRLQANFANWLGSSKVSARKQAKIIEHIKNHAGAWQALWNSFRNLQLLKDDIIKQFDSQEQVVKQEIGSRGPAQQDTHGPGGEGYVLAHPQGDIKLVPREFFSAANRSVVR